MAETMRRPWAPRPARVVALVVLTACIAVTSTILAGPAALPVRGKLVGWEKLLPQVYVEAAKAESHRFTWREPSPTVKQDFRRLSADVSRDVCVVALAASPSGQPHEPLSIKLTGGRLTPSTMVLPPGSRLSFKNADPFPHVLYEVGNPQWAASAMAAGSTREWAAPAAPGLHQIRDQLFPSVAMYVLVDPAATEYALPAVDGSFSMTVPPGDYTFRAYFEGKAVGKEVAGVHLADRGLEMREPMSVGGGDSK
ncbi:MAG TPA: hypothetical protein VKU41_26575 [Polyangiaceae bacterium]|nr:hypothetical protein [Polyangiaceae bacterium]